MSDRSAATQRARDATTAPADAPVAPRDRRFRVRNASSVFVRFDRRLSETAAAEGFMVLGETA
jgi:hypothetical protein